jgi:D-alanyl-D-alanine carboxypeptidase
VSAVVHAARLEAGGEVTLDTAPGARFPWWSFTKTLIAIAALRLVEQGRLELDAPVAGRPFTLRQLLQHRAGVPNYGGLEAYHAAVARGEAPWSRRRLLAEVGAERLDFPPGTGWAYSNVGYLLLREIVEEEEGAGLGVVFARQIAAPLGLGSLALAESPEDFVQTCFGNPRGYHPGWVYHGCAVGTALEAAGILQALVAGRLLGRDLLETMTRPHPLGGPIEGRPWLTTGYGLGLMIGTMEGVGRAIGHSGGGPLGTNAVYHFPEVARPVTLATFTDSRDEGVAEAAAARLAAGAG